MTVIYETLGTLRVQDQADATLSQASPGSGTGYPFTELANQENVEIIFVQANCTWTVQPSPIQVHIIGDGVTYQWNQGNPVSTTKYYTYLDPSLAQGGQALTSTGATIITMANPLLQFKFCTSVNLEVTGGTVGSLDGQVRWRKWV